jgi:BMFP domain-containing protein YqiC
MSDGFRAVFPKPPSQYNANDQQNNRREIQRALDYKLNRNEFEMFTKALKDKIDALEARIAALEPAGPVTP